MATGSMKNSSWLEKAAALMVVATWGGLAVSLIVLQSLGKLH